MRKLWFIQVQHHAIACLIVRGRVRDSGDVVLGMVYRLLSVCRLVECGADPQTWPVTRRQSAPDTNKTGVPGLDPGG